MSQPSPFQKRVFKHRDIPPSLGFIPIKCAIPTLRASRGPEVPEETLNLSALNLRDALWKCNVSVLFCQHCNTCLGNKVIFLRYFVTDLAV